jgi:PAS domain S-box-containing protein
MLKNQKSVGLTLGSQALLVVAALLLMELAFLGSFWRLLSETEKEVLKEEKSKMVLAELHKMLRVVYDGGAAFEFYYSPPSADTKKPFLGDINQVQEVLNSVSQKVYSERERQIIAHIDSELERTKGIVQKVITILETHSPVEPELVEKEKQKLHQVQQSLGIDVSELLKNESQIALTSPIAQRMRREEIKTLLLAAVPLSVILSVLLSLYFSRSITSRLDVLVENTYRLRIRAPLNPKLKGQDEISQLDDTFHFMADTLIRDEEMLKTSEARIRKVIDAMPIGLLVLDGADSIEFANPRLIQMLEYTEKELVGTSVQKLFATKIAPPEELSKSSSNSRASDVTELDALRKSGESLPVEISFTKFEDARGKRQLVTIVDVSINHEINRLRQAFVAMVSHELRAPLTSIRGFFSLLEMGAYGEVSAPILQDAKRAENNSVRLITLVNDLLDLEKVESGMLSITPAPVAVALLVEQAIDSVKILAQEKNVRLEVSCSSLVINVDTHRIVQVLVNLLSNAIKFSNSGSSVELKVGSDTTFAKFEVRDSGRGIPDRFKNLIFEKFQQVEESDATIRGGSGLGLPISKAIVERHGGAIWVDTEMGKGSTFSFRLPLFS